MSSQGKDSSDGWQVNRNNRYRRSGNRPGNDSYSHDDGYRGGRYQSRNHYGGRRQYDRPLPPRDPNAEHRVYYVKPYPPPEQPICTISSNNMFVYTNNLWKENNVDGLKKLLETIKGVRKSIMHVGSDDPVYIDKTILQKIENIKQQVIPVYLRMSQRLPTSPVKGPDGREKHLFDANIWYYIYRSMLPTIPIKHTQENFTILCEIYKNCLETNITRSYNSYTEASNTDFQNSLRAERLRKNRQTERTKALRTAAYSKHYKKYSEEKAHQLKIYYEDLMQIISEEDITGDSSIVTNAWKLFSLNLSETETCKSYELRNSFFKSHAETLANVPVKKEKVSTLLPSSSPSPTPTPETTDEAPKDEPAPAITPTEEEAKAFLPNRTKNPFKSALESYGPRNCDSITYNDWIKTYPTIATLDANEELFSHKLIALDELVKRDMEVITSIKNVIIHNSFIPYDENKKVYRQIGLFATDDEKQIASIINKLTPSNYSILKEDITEYSSKSILKSAFENVPLSFDSCELVVKLFRDLEIENELVSEYLSQLNHSTSKDIMGPDYDSFIAALYLHDYIDSVHSIESIYTDINLPSIILTISKNFSIREACTPETSELLKKELLYYAEKIKKENESNNKIKFDMMDVIDLFKPKKPEPKPKSTSQSAWKKKVMQRNLEDKEAELKKQNKFKLETTNMFDFPDDAD